MPKKVVVLIFIFTLFSLSAMEKSEKKEVFNPPSLQQLTACAIAHDIIDWNQDPQGQIKKIVPQLEEAIPELSPHTPDATEPISRGLRTALNFKLKRIQLPKPIDSFDHKGEIGITVETTSNESTITLLELATGNEIRKLTTYNKLQTALISPDTQYLVLLKELENNKKIIQLWNREKEKYQHEFSIPELEDISFIDNTPYLKIKLNDEKKCFFISLEELIEIKENLNSPQQLTEVSKDSLKEIRPTSCQEIISKPLRYFYDADFWVWSAQLPQDGFKQFVELDKIIESFLFKHAHVDPSGKYAVALEPDTSISVWDIAQKKRIYSQKFEEPGKILERAQWINDHSIMLKDSEGGLWHIDARNWKFLELLNQQLTPSATTNENTANGKDEL